MSVEDHFHRRLYSMVGCGQIQIVDDTKQIQYVQVLVSPLETIDGVPRAAEYGFTSNPPSGSDCVVVFAAGDRSDGVVVGTNHKASRLKNLQPGEVGIYNNQGASIVLKANGDILIASTTKVEVSAPQLKVDGDIVATGNISDLTRSMAADRAKYNAHVHPGVTAGAASTGTTSQPE